MSTSRKIFKYLGWILVTLLALAAVARIALAPLTSWAINDWFEQQGLESRIADISFDIGDGRFQLQGLAAESAGKPALGLERLEIAWSWSALGDQRLEVTALSIDGLKFDVERGGDGALAVAGIDLAAMAGEPQPDTGQAEPAKPLQWSLLLRDFAVTNTAVCYRQPPRIDYCSRLAALDWQGTLKFDLAAVETEALPLQVAGNFGLSEFEIRSNTLERVLMKFANLDFADIAIDGGDDIGIGEITLQTLDVFERAGDNEQDYIEHIDSIRVSGSRLAALDTLTIDEIAILGNAADFVKPTQQGYELNEWLEPFRTEQTAGTADSTTAGEAESASDQAPGEAFAFAVGKLVFETEKPLKYRDLSLKKPFVLGVSSTQLVVENIDSRQPDRPSNITYEAKLGGDSLFTLKGTATPLAKKISFDIGGNIRSLDLRNLSPFTATSIGHIIKSGQLDADIDLHAKQAVMNGKIDLTLYRFDLQALSEADAEAMEKELGFPLGLSMSLLKNRAGNIELKVPLSGDLDNPDFGTGKIVSRELSKAITSAVLTFYTPFGMVTAADALFSLATALKFEPVVFAAGESKIGEADVNSLDQIAVLMQERPGIQLRLCPFTNSADRAALLPRTAHTAAEDLKLNSSQQALLTELAEARFAAVEKYLAEKGADPARVIPCTPSHQEGEGLAGIEISI